MSLKILCLMKNTFPTDARIALDASGRISDANIKYIVNPYDEIAVEEAVKLRESAVAADVTVITVGGDEAMESLRRALAMGADSGVQIDPKGVELDESIIAAALVAAIRARPFDLIFCGKVAVDSNAAEVPGRIAEALGLPLVNCVGEIKVDGSEITASREADGQTEMVRVKLPSMLSADKNLNKPRYPSLPNIMKAKKKPVETITLASLLPDAKATRRTVGYALPPAKGPAKMLDGAASAQVGALVSLLRDEAKVLR